MSKETEIFMKLSSEAIIQELNIEAGKRESYIAELEDGIASMTKAIKGTAEDLREIRKDIVCKEYKAEMKRMRHTISALRKDKSNLISRFNRK